MVKFETFSNNKKIIVERKTPTKTGALSCAGAWIWTCQKATFVCCILRKSVSKNKESSKGPASKGPASKVFRERQKDQRP